MRTAQADVVAQQRPAVRFTGVGRRIGGQRLLDEVSLEVPEGSCFALVGVNGAGKTTLIKAMLDLTHIDSGEIRIHGRPHRQPRARSGLAFLPERFAAPYFLRGNEFLSHMARLYGRPVDAGAVGEILEQLELPAAALARPVRTYSKGMTQKLGLAACLLSRRPLLVLDEPMSGLDVRARARLRQLLARWHEEGHTLLFTSHVLADVAELCDHMAIVHDGRLRFAGPPGDALVHTGCADLETAFLSLTDPAPTAGACNP